MLALAGSPPCGAAAPPVPPVFQDLYTTLNGDLNAFNTTLGGLWNGSPYPVLWTGTLTIADANSGPQLVNAGYYNGVQLQLQALKAMGAQAVMVEVGFPMLYQPFFSSQAQYQQFVDFYAQVAAGVRALGMKLVVENNCLLSDDAQAGWNSAPFYATLDWTQYQAARAQTAAVIAQTMRPDYMVVLEEPDTEAAQAGQSNANTVAGATGMLSQILSSVRQSGVTGMKVGAGVGSWLYGFQDFIQSFVTLPVDFIDMHVYPVNLNFLPNALAIASTAAAAGKPVAMTECWLNKVRDDELNVLSASVIRAREPFSFWAPLDQYFLQTVEDMANYTQMIFMAPTNSSYFFAYQPYNNTTANMTPVEILTQEMSLMAQANQQASYTSTGLSYYHSILPAPDTIPPSTPANLAGVSGTPTSVYLTWDAAADNVGVAGYSLFRDGVKIATTAQTYYQDSGLTGSTTYTYAIRAFDLGRNESPFSPPVSVATRDVIPPSAPANVAGTAVSCKQINVTWSPSTDDVGITAYKVFAGTSPAALSQIGGAYSPATSFIDYPLNPATKYYFAVEAVDTSGNVSPLSALAAATTLALPSAPASLTATPLSSKQIGLAWSASTSGMPLLGYYIFRGSSPSSLSQVATVAGTSYTDYQLTPATTYYYAVQALDSGGNVSPMSAKVAATTLP
jgi:chitodextrinase